VTRAGPPLVRVAYTHRDGSPGMAARAATVRMLPRPDVRRPDRHRCPHPRVYCAVGTVHLAADELKDKGLALRHEHAPSPDEKRSAEARRGRERPPVDALEAFAGSGNVCSRDPVRNEHGNGGHGIEPPRFRLRFAVVTLNGKPGRQCSPRSVSCNLSSSSRRNQLGTCCSSSMLVLVLVDRA